MKKILFVMLCAVLGMAFTASCTKSKSEEEIRREIEDSIKTAALQAEVEALKQQNQALQSSSSSHSSSSSSSSYSSSSNRSGGATGEGLYPFASERRLSYDDLAGYSAYELKIMRNEIYARHGYIFHTAAMKSYFAAQPWYVPRYSDVSLSSIENHNVKIIKELEGI